TPARDVADDEPEPPAGQRDRVVPVAPHLRAVPARMEVRGQREPRDVGEPGGQEVALERRGDVVLALVDAHALQHERDPFGGERRRAASPSVIAATLASRRASDSASDRAARSAITSSLARSAATRSRRSQSWTNRCSAPSSGSPTAEAIAATGSSSPRGPWSTSSVENGGPADARSSARRRRNASLPAP